VVETARLQANVIRTNSTTIMEADQPASDNKGPALLASVYSLHAIALIVYFVRLWTRLVPKFAMTAADYTITVSLVSLRVPPGAKRDEMMGMPPTNSHDNRWLGAPRSD